MWFHSLFASWKSGLCRSRRPQPRPARRGTRLFVEQLEDRALPSSYTAASVSDLIADINAANAAGGANTISLTAPTTSPYVLSDVDNTTNGATGLPVIAANDNLTIIGNGNTIERSSGSGTPAFRLLDVAAGASLTLQSLTLQNGLAYGTADYPFVWLRGTPAQGGAVYNQGTLDLNGVTVQGNIAQGVPGGGVGIAGGQGEGGGIYSTGFLTMERTTLQNNQALGGAGGWSFPVTDTGWGDASGGDGLGGGVYLAGGTATLTNDTLSSNTAQGGQGGISGLYSGIINSAPSYYTAPGGRGGGGALEMSGGTVSLTGLTLSSNIAQGGQGGNNFINYLNYRNGINVGGYGFGGGLDVSGGTVTLTNTTVSSNTAQAGASGYGAKNKYAGKGEGGGLNIDPYATVYLDSFTVNHTKQNTATIAPNIDGTYILQKP